MIELTDKTKIKPKIVPITAGDYAVFCRVMTGEQRDQWADHTSAIAQKEADAESLGIYYSTLIAQCVCNAAGERIFDSAIEANASLDAVNQEAMFAAVMTANGMGPKGTDEAKKN
jgi:hypothetical protein